MYRPTLSLTSAIDGGLWSTPRPDRFTPGKDTVPIVQEAGWAPGPVWTGAENLAPIGIRSPDRPACSESLYRLRYPGSRVRNLNSHSLKQRFALHGCATQLLTERLATLCVGVGALGAAVKLQE
jgi:hypothetical protein